MSIRMIRRASSFAAAAGLIAVLAGCAHPGPAVQSVGALPRDDSYAFAEDAAPPPALAPLLTGKLAERGLRVTDKPRYLVQAEYSRPIAKTGTLATDQSDPHWQRAPSHKGRQLSRVSLSVMEIATGTEVYHATAWQPLRGKTDDSALLLQTALSPPADAPAIPPPPPPPPIP